MVSPFIPSFNFQGRILSVNVDRLPDNRWHDHGRSVSIAFCRISRQVLEAYSQRLAT